MMIVVTNNYVHIEYNKNERNQRKSIIRSLVWLIVASPIN